MGKRHGILRHGAYGTTPAARARAIAFSAIASNAMASKLRWPDLVDAILAADQAIMLATVTPAKGVVLLPVTNFGVRDREAGTITAVNSSVGGSKKLERMRRDPPGAPAHPTRPPRLRAPAP